MVDVERKGRGRVLRWVRRVVVVVVVAAVLAVTTVALSRLERAAPVVEADTVWMAVVERGELVRQVRGNGTLVPEEVWWIPAPSEGRVEGIHLKPGEAVEPDTVIMDLGNPVLERDLLDAEWELSAAEAGLENLEADLSNRQLEQEETLAVVESERHVAKLQVDRDRQLFEEGLLAEHDLDISLAKSGALETQAGLIKRRLAKMRETVDAQLAVQQAKVEQFRALVALRRDQLEALHVKAGTVGALQQLLVEVGQPVTTATTLAKIGRPDELKAELEVSETQMRDVQVGQPVEIDTWNGVVQGRVARIDPAVVAGTVTVEVTLEGALPKGARPDLSVEGVIEIERLADVLHVGRPVGARPETSISLFKLGPEGDLAVRTPVQLGRSSVNAIEVVQGLDEGDRVIVSDMSKWEAVDKVRLK